MPKSAMSVRYRSDEAIRALDEIHATVPSPTSHPTIGAFSTCAIWFQTSMKSVRLSPDGHTTDQDSVRGLE